MRNRFALTLAVSAFLPLLAGCGGGGSPPGDSIPHPLVRQFSPTMSPIDFNNGQANPTYTDGQLLVSTDPAYPGKIVVFFQSDTEIDDSSVFIGGNPALGIDLSALQILQFIPGIGNIPVEAANPPSLMAADDPTNGGNGDGRVSFAEFLAYFDGGSLECLSAPQTTQIFNSLDRDNDGFIEANEPPGGVEVLGDRIIFTPAAIAGADGLVGTCDDGALPNGQYSIGVFANLKSTEGDPVLMAPVFHSFTVGSTDTIAPVVVVTNPINGATGVGAGIPPPPPPAGLPSTSIADVRTTIFGPTSPDVIIRFSESIDANSVSPNTIIVTDAGANTIPPPTIPPEPSFPMLKSQFDQSSLPSNGFEVIWRADRLTQGGFPFGTQIAVQVVGAIDPESGQPNASPIRDRSGNALAATYRFQFQTIAPPDLPENIFQEYAIYFATSERVGVIDTINIKDRILGNTPILLNRIPEFSDKITTKANLGVNFDPQELSVDARASATTGHTYLYVMSSQSGQVVIVNTRNSLPVAIINTPSPGGIANQTGTGQAANVLLVSNSSANTITTFNVGSYVPGLASLNGPIFIDSVVPTGNTPRAITITAPVTLFSAYNREFAWTGPGDPIIMYAEFADGVVNTTNLNRTTPVKQFALGSESAPNDISVTPCFNPLNPILFAAISQGGTLGEGKVAYYIAGPGCTTGFQSSGRPDAIVGDVSGLDAPAGLDNIFPTTPDRYFFAVAESGANQIHMLGLQPGTINLPLIVRTYRTGDNPTSMAHKPSWQLPVRAPLIFGTHPFRTYQNLTGWGALTIDGSGDPSNDLYVCVRGAGRIEVINSTSGSRPPPGQDIIAIPGVRTVAGCGSQ